MIFSLEMAAPVSNATAPEPVDEYPRVLTAYGWNNWTLDSYNFAQHIEQTIAAGRDYRYLTRAPKSDDYYCLIINRSTSETRLVANLSELVAHALKRRGAAASIVRYKNIDCLGPPISIAPEPEFVKLLKNTDQYTKNWLAKEAD